MKHKLFHVITTAALTMSLLIGSAFCEDATHNDFVAHAGYVPLSVEITPEYTIKLPAVMEFEEISKNTYVANVPAIANISIGSNNMLQVYGSSITLTLEDVFDNPSIYSEYLEWYDYSNYRDMYELYGDEEYSPTSEYAQKEFLLEKHLAFEIDNKDASNKMNMLFFVENGVNSSDVMSAIYPAWRNNHNINIIHCTRGTDTNSASNEAYLGSYKLETDNPDIVKTFGKYTGSAAISYCLKPITPVS